MALKTGKTSALFTIAAVSVAALMMYGCSQQEPTAPDPAPQQRQQPAAQAGPTQYATIDDAVEAFNDFPVEFNQFELVSDSPQPLMFRLSPFVMLGDSDDVARDESLRAVLYGVYRTFIHTDAVQVGVVSVPMVLTDIREVPGKLVPEHNYMVKVSRAEALKAAQEALDVKTFADLVGKRVADYDFPDSFTDKYEHAVHDPERLQALAKRLGVTQIKP